MRYLFDTDTCISLLDHREPDKQRNILARLDKLQQADIALSSITVSELVFGAENGLHRKANLEALEKAGRRIGAMDTLIAAHAKVMGLTVVTNNVAHFGKVKGLKVENWSV